MSQNKRVPREVQKYMVMRIDNTSKSKLTEYRYFKNQKDAKEWAKGKSGKLKLFRIDFDFYGEL